ncbi:unnamed protein product [Dovyalis caffra]|uniref:Uncharacterized protein n=1 Tax=Dovyalis caffra TaxID=77055 RepID=A0AAV1QS35_9ROSI|nr:unnamed protein product [Dovyalis caffra]
MLVVVVEPQSHHGSVLKKMHVKWNMCYSYSLQNPTGCPVQTGICRLGEDKLKIEPWPDRNLSMHGALCRTIDSDPLAEENL